MKNILLSLFIILMVASCGKVEKKQEALHNEIFPTQEEHAHGATIVELPNGDMLAAWFQGYGERWADDVKIMGSRLHRGSKEWTKPFVMVDVPGFPDINPVLFIDQHQTLWLMWYTVIANQWSTSLPRYIKSDDYMQREGVPNWNWQDVIVFKPGDKTERGVQPGDKFVVSVEKQVKAQREILTGQNTPKEMLNMFDAFSAQLISKAKGEDMLKRGKIKLSDGTTKDTLIGYPYFRRMGWQTKNKAVFVGDRIIIPFYSDGLNLSIMAITDDFGKTWKFSTPLVGMGNIQPTIAFKKDGTLTAYMRDNGPPPKRHMVSESNDNGLTWSIVKDDQLVNEGSGSDMVTLADGHWVMVYNDSENGRWTLAVTISEDEGKTWKYSRHIELDTNEDVKKRDKFSYPSVIQGKDGMIHVVYSWHKHNTLPHDDDNIKYFRFTEEWVKGMEEGRSR